MKLFDLLEGDMDFNKMLNNPDADPRASDKKTQKEKFDQQAQRLRAAKRKNNSRRK